MAEIERRKGAAPAPTSWDYAPAPESRDAARIAPSYDLFIGGEFVAPRDGRRAPTVNPAMKRSRNRL